MPFLKTSQGSALCQCFLSQAIYCKLWNLSQEKQIVFTLQTDCTSSLVSAWGSQAKQNTSEDEKPECLAALAGETPLHTMHFLASIAKLLHRQIWEEKMWENMTGRTAPPPPARHPHPNPLNCLKGIKTAGLGWDSLRGKSAFLACKRPGSISVTEENTVTTKN